METRLSDAFRIGAIASRRSRLLDENRLSSFARPTDRPIQLCPISRASLAFARPISPSRILGRRQVTIRRVEQTGTSIDRGRF